MENNKDNNYILQEIPFKINYLYDIHNLRQFVNEAEGGELKIDNKKVYIDDYILKKLKIIAKTKKYDEYLYDYFNSEEEAQEELKNRINNILDDYLENVLYPVFKTIFSSNNKYVKIIKNSISKKYNIDKSENNINKILYKLGIIKKIGKEGNKVKKGKNYTLAKIPFFKKFAFDNEHKSWLSPYKNSAVITYIPRGKSNIGVPVSPSIKEFTKYSRHKKEEYTEFFKYFIESFIIAYLKDIKVKLYLEKNNNEKLSTQQQEFLQSIFISDIVNNNRNYKNYEINNLTVDDIKTIILNNIDYVKFIDYDKEYIKNNVLKLAEIFFKNKTWILSGIKQGNIIKKNILNNSKEKYIIYNQNIFLDNLWNKTKELIKKEKPELVNENNKNKDIDRNKWNPADIYLIKIDNNNNNNNVNTEEKLKEIKNELINSDNIYELNNKLKNLIIKNEVIPFSLKKIQDNEPFYMLKNFLNSEENYRENLKEAAVFDIVSANLGFGNSEKNKIGIFTNKYVKFNSFWTGFEIRTFNNHKTNTGKSIAGEVSAKNSNARHGKIGTSIMLNLTELFIKKHFEGKEKEKLLELKNKIDKALDDKNKNNIKPSEVIDLYLEVVNSFIKHGIKIDGIEYKEKFNYYTLCKEIFKNNKAILIQLKKRNNINELKFFIDNNLSNFFDKYSNKEYSFEDWLISKYGSLLLSNLFFKITKIKGDIKYLNKLLTWHTLYASAELDISAPHYKPFESKELLRELIYYIKKKKLSKKINFRKIFEKYNINKDRKKIEEKLLNFILKNKDKLDIKQEEEKIFKDIYKLYYLKNELKENVK